MPFNIPTPVRYALSLLAGLLAVLNETTFHAGSRWSGYIAAALVFLASLGVPPVIGQAFQRLLGSLFPGHWLTVARALITAGLAAGVLALTTNHWSTAVHAIVAGVITILSGLGFGQAEPSAIATGTFWRKPAPASRKK